MNCPRCGREGPEYVCPVCGAKRRRLTVWILAIAAVLILLLAAVAGLLWWRYEHHGGADTDPLPVTDWLPDSTTASNTVMVTVPEGYTVEKIAALMEKSGVCSAAAFREAVQTGDFADYPFVTDISLTGEDGEPNGRCYRLEGYLFPDTYEFYRNSSGEAAVKRFLQNFQQKQENWSAALERSGLTLDEAVTLASIIQGEARGASEMKRVSRVLHNRLESVDYPRLQCDVTTKYLRDLAAAEVSVKRDVYDTYVCYGLPVGAINNPGLSALTAAVSPSQEDICAGCYFFVTDEANDTVYYTKTYAEHLAVCREHKLGGFAES